MKPDTIKTGVMPATARDSARISGNHRANLPNDLGKSRKEKIMGGFGSGRGQGGKDTTSDMRPLDIRKLQRNGLLTPGRAFGWHWTRNGEEVASIQMRTEVDRVILNYRSRSNGGEWQPMEYPVNLEWTPCNIGAMPVTARNSARIGGNDTANLPNDLGKSRKEKNHGRLW